jgi:hypothetical protein
MAANRRTFRYGCPALESIGPNKWERCHDNASILDMLEGGIQDTGIIPTADIPILANPAPGDTMIFTVGAAIETFTFVAGAPATAYEITIGATEPETIDNAVAVINGCWHPTGWASACAYSTPKAEYRPSRLPPSLELSLLAVS